MNPPIMMNVHSVRVTKLLFFLLPSGSAGFSGAGGSSMEVAVLQVVRAGGRGWARPVVVRWNVFMLACCAGLDLVLPAAMVGDRGHRALRRKTGICAA